MVCGVDNAFSLDDFKGRFSIDVTSLGAHCPRRPPQRMCACLRAALALCARHAHAARHAAEVRTLRRRRASQRAAHASSDAYKTMRMQTRAR
jgi:hypothetical protein